MSERARRTSTSDLTHRPLRPSSLCVQRGAARGQCARELGRPGSELIKIHGVHAGCRANERVRRHATNNVFNQTTEPQICASVRHERTNSKRMHLYKAEWDRSRVQVTDADAKFKNHNTILIYKLSFSLYVRM
jgi:hypothetical protein